MEFDPPLQHGVLKRRYKRFLADIRSADGELTTIHCANTGAMRGCSTPGSKVWYSTSSNPDRKYRHSLEIVETADDSRVCVNTARANLLVREAIENGQIVQLRDVSTLRPEIAIPGESGRFDLGNENLVIEIKSVTWLHGEIGSFPDAVSQRATRHAEALLNCAKNNMRAVLFFCVPHTGIHQVTVSAQLDPNYGRAVWNAIDGGVEVLAYRWDSTPHGIELDKELSFVPP